MSAARQAPRATTLAAIVARGAEPFATGADADLRPLLERIGKARVVLLGEASHGTAEFYEMRARITRALIAEDPNVRIVAVEADWPDARQMDRCVRGEMPDTHPERAFTRFPTWMWANRQVLSFAKALREWNRAQLGEAQVDIEGGRYACIVHTGPYPELQTAYDWLYRAWLPTRDEEPRDMPCVEEYLNAPRQVPAKDLRTALLLPIEG